jgi:BASS family bile acid:Na+ symporter
LNDLILFVVTFGSTALAVVAPNLGTVFQPYILYFMMCFLFLSFLKIDFRSFVDTSASSLASLGLLASVKLVVLPAVLYGAALVLLSDYALPVLLISGISTGVVAPFVASLVEADIALTLRMTIVSSVLVPFSLPVLVKALAGTDITIPLEPMIRLLALVIFIPMIAVLLLRRFFPSVPDKIAARQFPISLVFFSIINLGVFSKYSSVFFDYPGQLLVATVLAYFLSFIYYAVGFAITPGKPLAEQLGAGVSFAQMNNVLVIVFSAQFFGPLCPILAAMYMFPFFTMIVPVKLYASFRRGRSVETSGPA